MKFIIGGAYQGKTEAALKMVKENPVIIDGKDCPILTKEGQADILLNLHLYIKRRLSESVHPLDEIKEFLNHNKNIVVVCDEIGYGIVPMTKFDREYRELTGRIGCCIAKEAKEVIRVICGIEKKIKP